MDPVTLDRLADLAVTFGSNLQAGQTLALTTEPGKEDLARAVAASAYRHGARFVDLSVFDPYLKRARVEFADEEALDYVPPWLGARMLALGEHRCARIALSGPVAPGLLDDLDPQRVGRDTFPFLRESMQVLNDQTTNWTIVPCPTAEWAGLVHPSLPPDAALARLEHQLLHVLRLDEDDPVAAWGERMDQILRAAAALTERRFDALHFEGPGTDLTIGLLPTSRWLGARFRTVDGIEHHPNLPTEETFTTPDPLRTEGVVRSTKPLVLAGGTIVRDLAVTFEGGRAVRFDSSAGGAALAALAARDEGGVRLGEVALVDGGGRIGPLDTIFYDTLLDENAASHIAIGRGFDVAVDEQDRARVNDSGIHVDFMIGGPEVTVTGVTGSGERVPVLAGEVWQV